jgi:hypothetical protein
MNREILHVCIFAQHYLAVQVLATIVSFDRQIDTSVTLAVVVDGLT